MVFYIGLDEPSYTPGGLGHCMFDIISVFILAKHFDMVPVVKPLACTPLTSHGIDSGLVNADREAIVPRLHLDKFPGVVSQTPTGIPVRRLLLPYRRYSYVPLATFARYLKRDGPPAIYTLGRNHRVAIHDAMKVLSVETLVMRPLRNLADLPKPFDKRKLSALKLVLHLRRGDVSAQPLSIDPYLERLPLPFTLQVFSAGTDEQMSAICRHYSNKPYAQVHINAPLLTLFEAATNADILFVWQGGLHRMLGWYVPSTTVVVYQPAVMPRYRFGHEAYSEWRHWLSYDRFTWKNCQKILSLK